jgi:hypothetical protein
LTLIGEALGGAAAALGRRAVDAAMKRTKKKGAPRAPQRGKKTRPNAPAEDRIAKALVGLRRSASADPALDDFREDLFSELRKLIRPAIGQAKKGKPALLRILTRYSR